MSVTVRPAAARDSRAVWAWRNDPITRAASLSIEEVSWETHRAWFASIVERDDRHLLVAEAEGAAVGVVRFDRLDDASADWEISVNIAPEARGRGLGLAVVEAGHSWLDAHTAGGAVLATVRPDNAASLRLFLRAGYHEESRSDTVALLVRRSS